MKKLLELFILQHVMDTEEHVIVQKKKTRKTPWTHDCRRSWAGISKDMKPDMCIRILKDLGEKDVQVGTIIMDNDTTTIARARTEVNPALKKQRDNNHTLKQFTNK